MNTTRLLPWLLLSSLAFAACGDDGDSGNDDGAADDDSDDDDSDDDDAPDDDGDTSDDDTSDDEPDTNSCDGDWYLGSVPFTGDSFIETCDDNPPRTCLTGNYIVFGDGECFCLPECSQAGLSEGEDCTNDGSVTCTQIENDEGTSSGVFCVPPQWGLCG